MPKDQFAHEKPLVVHLLRCLRVEPDARLTNPNLDGESGADVLAIISGRRIGVQVTQIDSAYSLPGATYAPAIGRGAEKRVARESQTYGRFAEQDLMRTCYNRVFLLTGRGTQRALFKWAKPSGPWSVNVEPDTVPSLSFDELMVRTCDAAWSGDLDAWSDREVQKILAQGHGTTSEGS